LDKDYRANSLPNKMIVKGYLFSKRKVEWPLIFQSLLQIAVKREPAVEKEMSKLDTDKKMSKKEKEERVLWKKNEVKYKGKC